MRSFTRASFSKLGVLRAVGVGANCNTCSVEFGDDDEVAIDKKGELEKIFQGELKKLYIERQ